jgi:hypothetical protein
MDTPREHRFLVYGVAIAVVERPGGWSTFVLGPDGKRRPAGIVVPGFIEADELAQYLADLLHELARPGNTTVKRLG